MSMLARCVVSLWVKKRYKCLIKDRMRAYRNRIKVSQDRIKVCKITKNQNLHSRNTLFSLKKWLNKRSYGNERLGLAWVCLGSYKSALDGSIITDCCVCMCVCVCVCVEEMTLCQVHSSPYHRQS